MPRPRLRPSAESGELFPIRTVSHLTGVNAVTLRAWERRHGLIKPQRTPSGHRLYGPAPDRSHSQHPRPAREGSGDQPGRARARRAGRRSGAAEQGPWSSYRERIVGAVARYDDDELEEVYSQALEPVPDRDRDGAPSAAACSRNSAGAGKAAKAAWRRNTSSLTTYATSWVRDSTTVRARDRSANPRGLPA